MLSTVNIEKWDNYEPRERSSYDLKRLLFQNRWNWWNYNKSNLKSQLSGRVEFDKHIHNRRCYSFED